MSSTLRIKVIFYRRHKDYVFYKIFFIEDIKIMSSIKKIDCIILKTHYINFRACTYFVLAKISCA